MLTDIEENRIEEHENVDLIHNDNIVHVNNSNERIYKKISTKMR